MLAGLKCISVYLKEILYKIQYNGLPQQYTDYRVCKCKT